MIVPLSPTAQASKAVRSLLVFVTLFTRYTEFKFTVVGLVTLVMLDVCANTKERVEHSIIRHSTKASFNENFILVFSPLVKKYSFLHLKVANISL